MEQGVTSVQVWTLVIAGLAVLTSGAGLITTWALNRRTERESWKRNQRLARYSDFLATCSELRNYIHDELVRTLSSGPAPAAVREEFRQRQLVVQAKAVEVFLLAKEETEAAVLAYIDWTIDGLPAWPSGSQTIEGDPRWTAALNEGISRYISMLAPMRRELGVEDELLLHAAPRASRYFKAPPSPTGPPSRTDGLALSGPLRPGYPDGHQQECDSGAAVRAAVTLRPDSWWDGRARMNVSGTHRATDRPAPSAKRMGVATPLTSNQSLALVGRQGSRPGPSTGATCGTDEHAWPPHGLFTGPLP